MQRTNIPAAISQEVLDSAPNAAQKGLSQFFTSQPLATRLADALPDHRPVLVDLNCGQGDLLQASARAATTKWLLGSDIHNARKVGGGEARGHNALINFTQLDLTVLYPLLVELDWTADCFVLNPPWRLFWHRARLAALAESEVPAVRRAFAVVEPGSPRSSGTVRPGCVSDGSQAGGAAPLSGTIDSTIATLMIALDRCTSYGEGYLIANNKTLERLIFAAGAPYADLARHCWARIVIPGNPMTGITGCQWQEDEVFETGVIYFAREHPHGPRVTLRWEEWRDGGMEHCDPNTPSLPHSTSAFPVPSRAHRLGGSIRNAYAPSDQTLPKWNIVKEQVRELNGSKPKTPWNLWLDGTGYIRTGLSSFEQASKKLNKTAAARLHALNGKSPMQLVLQRADRDEVLDVAERGGWREQPALHAAVQAAIVQYHASRAPLYPLSDIQRLGYTDEEDFLVCKKALATFRLGRKYPLRSQTITVTRKTQKPNLVGTLEDFEYTGQELAMFLDQREYQSDPDAPADPTLSREFSFLDAKLRADKETRVPEARRHGRGVVLPEEPIDFTLQELVEHFIIPAVPDVATVNPEGYATNLRRLEELEAAANALQRTMRNESTPTAP